MCILLKYYRLTKKEKDNLISNLTEALKKIEGIKVAYLFGSLPQGKVSVKNVDIALLMDERNASPRLRVEEKIRSKLSPLSSPLPVDVVLLNSAKALFRHEVIKTGKSIFVRDEEERIQFEVASENEYFDFEPIRNLFWEATEKRLSDGSFGFAKQHSE